MNAITLDFETFYSSAYSLSKLTTEEYLRSYEFETIGVSVKVGETDAQWFSGTKEETQEFLDQFDWDNSLAIAHNARFDMAILNWHFGIKPKHIADTLSMARALHGSSLSVSLSALATHYDLGAKGGAVYRNVGKTRESFSRWELAEYGAYCVNDTELTYKLFRKLLPSFPLNELKLIDLTIRMFTEPVLELSPSVLLAHLHDTQSKKQDLLNRSPADIASIMSNEKLADVLKSFGIDPPTKISAATRQETWAFAKSDEEFMALLEHEDTRVQALIAARLGIRSTLEETRTTRFLEIQSRGTLPIPLRYYAAHTGRWGGDDKINMQNLPRTSPLKHAILAPPGFVLVDADSSQIEARVLAWWSGQLDLVDAFARGEDVYKLAAASLYGTTPEEITPAQRFIGKTVTLGAGYGLGWKKFQAHMRRNDVSLSDTEAQYIIHTYRETYPHIPDLWDQAGYQALPAIMGNKTTPLGRRGVVDVEGEEGIHLPNGLYLQYPNLQWLELNPGEKPQYVYETKRGRAALLTKIYGGKMVENITQALARIIIGEQMLKIAKRYKVVMTVHDAVCCVVPEQEAEEAKKFVELCMKLRPSWAPDLPLNCEVGIGASYGACK